MTAPADLPRCPRCRYALINGVCPIHGGRQGRERLSMMAPLPAKPGADELARARKYRRRPRWLKP